MNSKLICLCVFFLASLSVRVKADCTPTTDDEGSVSKAMASAKLLAGCLQNTCQQNLADATFVANMKSKCLDTLITPCLPSSLSPYIQTCVTDVGILNDANLCVDSYKTGVVNCVNGILKDSKKKKTLMDLFKQYMKLVCERLTAFQNCFTQTCGGVCPS